MGGWTKDEPTIDGYYWWRADANDWEPDIHEVFDGYFYEIGHPVKTVVANFGGEWLGPIVSDDCIQPGSLNQDQRGRAALLAESRGVDIDTAAELVYLRDRVKELDGHDVCVVCSADLVLPSGPPHCENCFVTDAHLDDWEEANQGL